MRSSFRELPQVRAVPLDLGDPGRSGRRWTAWTSISAAAARVLLAPGAEHHGRTYVLTGGESSTMDEVAQVIGQALDKQVRYVAVEAAQYREGMLRAGLPEVIADAILGWFEYCRAGRADRVVPDLEHLLGRKPTGLAAFVRDHAARYR